MKLLCAILVTVAAMHAGPITLERGASAVFHFGIWNFALNAGEYPERIDITLESQAGLAGTLTATLESLDGSVALPLVAAGMSQGYVSNGSYTGPSTLFEAGISLPADTAAELFGPASLAPWSDGATLRIRNAGDPYAIGLPDTPVTAAIDILLQGNAVSVGGVPGVVEIQPAPRMRGAAAAAVHVPEPAPAGLAAAGMALICALFRRRSSIQ